MTARRLSLIASLFIAAAALAGTAPDADAARHARKGKKPDVFKIPNSQLVPVNFADIEGWPGDQHSEAFATFLASCKAILRSSPKARAERGRLYGALFTVCERAVAAVPLDDEGARNFFEQNFKSFRISPVGEREGFITGYYEPIAEGSRTKSEQYSEPLYRRPPDLTMARLRKHRAPKGKAAWRKGRPRAAAYFDRAQIEDGALAGRSLEICWLKDPIDAFFAQIQGSLRVRLEDGSVIRLNYDSQNGHPYFAVGRTLVDRGIVAKDDISMQKIRDWMVANPEEGKALRRQNKSYVFFRESALQEHDEAIGAQGLSLTAGRSIAVDRNLHTYGTPFFLDAQLPIASEKPDTQFRRLMIAQDTGGAITGPARADIYLGTGEDAARPAGRFKQFGRFVMLIPRELNPAMPQVPLPRAKPKAADTPKVAAKPATGGRAKAAAETASKKPQIAAKKPEKKPVQAAADKPKPKNGNKSDKSKAAKTKTAGAKP